jgi:O-antigen ligase/tetratricopeptide (TPR) repeat protein
MRSIHEKASQQPMNKGDQEWFGVLETERFSSMARRRQSVPDRGVLVGIIQYLLILTLLASPWAFGGVDTTHFFWPSVIISLVLWAWTIGSKNVPTLLLPWCIIPILLVLVWIGFQMIPLPTEWVQQASPVGYRFWSEAAFPFDAGLPGQLTLSLFPEGGAQQTTWLLLGLCFYLLAAQFLRDRNIQVVFVAAIAFLGAAVACFAVIQSARWQGKLYWFFELMGNVRPYGPFVNRNHAAAFINLCFPAGIALVTWLSSRNHQQFPAGTWIESDGPFWSRPFRNFGPGHVLALAFLAMMSFGLVASLSRGGLASFVAGLGAAILAFGYERQRENRFRIQSYFLVAILLLGAGIGVTLLIGYNEKALARLLATFEREDEGQRARAQHWRDMQLAVKDFWLTGSGLGTYAFVHRPYTRNDHDKLFEHADNTYLEILVELGFVGILCLTAFMVLSFCALHVLLRRDTDDFGRIFACGAVFVLVSQVVHAVVDFPLYSPANLMLFCVWMGSATGRACRMAGPTQDDPGFRWVVFPTGRWRAVSAAPLALLFVGGVWAWRESWVQETLYWTLREHRRAPATDATTLATANAWVQQLDALNARFPNRMMLEWQLAERWIDRCRVQARESAQVAQPAADPKKIWVATGLEYLYAQVMSAARGRRMEELEGIRNSPAVAQNLGHAKSHLIHACELNPLAVQPRLRLAQLTFLFESAVVRDRLVDHALRIAPGNSDINFYAGLLDFYADRREQVIPAWRKSLEINPRWMTPIFQHSVNWLGLSNMLQRVFPPDPRLLAQLAEQHFSEPKFAKERAVVMNRVLETLPQAVVEPYQRFELAARAFRGLGQMEKAIENMQLAVRERGSHPHLHYQLSLMFVETGDLPRALDEADAAAVLGKGNPLYQNHAVSIRTQLAKRLNPQKR